MTAPDHTAVRVALWRALHLADAPPHVLADEVGLRLAGPDEGWRDRPDMDMATTARFRASIVARSRFVEDLVRERAVPQYVLLGAGLDTFAQRAPGGVRVFEIDQPGTQEWKRARLMELGLPLPYRFVPVDFEAGENWVARLVAAGFDPARPAVVASTGVSMYLTREANAATLRALAAFAAGTVVAMTFQTPVESLSEEDRAGRQMAVDGAKAAGTPFLSFFAPEEMLELARECGFADVRHVSAAELNRRYFAGRPDGLATSKGEEFLVATTGDVRERSAGGS
ncbi:class I SAM-dependent methyltransferase [Amycolatopsis jiangsuensis]|uniref:S-adenosyl-L-methionine-dependent methyltransferase n=1 Tax=Amycolatopsis jiangsuensis TaxID=1181879 RepID=A0A840IV54_9PSEU|nr:class I SAM-dependent methyltransferase [Amycolatopsis jiangsuensis]MBB4685315.1 methyltransferase (TIGR00027 family) [Amycolatopsis jiangsuensis]